MHQSVDISYPLINCTHCGSPFSIIWDLPYDRAQTTMSSFVMCPQCRSEYSDVQDRRFHAQPVGCNTCGPVYSLDYAVDSRAIFQDILERPSALLSGDVLMAIKGMGGFHLVYNALSTEAISRLRSMIQRDGKPFAVMFISLEAPFRTVFSLKK